MTIKLSTQRFGIVQRTNDDVISFPGGIYGFELQRDWLLLGDREHGGLYWLQSVEQMDLSLSVVNPREFISGYTLHVQRNQLSSVWNGTETLTVLAVLTEYDQQLCLNLRNPVVINPTSRVGSQVVASDERPLQYVLPEQALSLQKSA